MEPKAYSYIRFSTPEQEKGDSLRRQVEQSEKYAKEKGLILDDQLNMQDRGLSAFKGTHRAKGALGEFLKLVENGEIAKGSILIVENLDRLSREQVLDALSQFTGIINAGIKLITLTDGQEYTRESIHKNWTQLIISITYMARAHEESERKSQLLSAAWNNKRDMASKKNKVLTQRCPLWLRLNENGNFELIPAAVDAIKQIFELRAQGIGTHRIVAVMNKNQSWKPPINKRNKTGGWQKYYVNKLLRAKALLGEFQPCKRESPFSQKKIPVGEPIVNYFPPALERSLFQRVQAILEKNKHKAGHGGGMTGKAHNLFVHVIKCGYCGGNLHYINKGNYGYLVCDRSRRKLLDENRERMCSAKSIPYNEFTKIFFNDFTELDISEILENKGEQMEKIQALKQNLESLAYEISEIERRKQNLIDQLADEDNTDLRRGLSARYASLDEGMQDKVKEKTQLNHQLSELQSNGKGMQQNINNARELFNLLDKIKTDSKDAIDLRLKLRHEIQKTLEWIKVYPTTEKISKAPDYEMIEPGVVRWIESKSISKLRIKFKNAKKLRIIYCQGLAELE